MIAAVSFFIQGLILCGLFIGQGVVIAQQPAAGSVVTWGRVFVNHQDSVPVTPVPEVRSNVTAVATGNPWSIAARADGSVVIWISDWLSPYGVQSSITPAQGVRKVVAGYSPAPFFDSSSPAAALRSDGSVMLWRMAGLEATPEALRSGVKDIAFTGNETLSGYNLLFAALEDGRVIVSPTQGVPEYLKPPVNPVGATALAGGAAHVLALRADGSVLAWGADYSGQTDVPAPAQSDVIAIAASEDHSLALRHDGSVIAWGSNKFGESDVPAAARSGVVAVAAGWLHSVALKSDGTVVTWGNNGNRQSDVPPGIQGRVSAISAGEYHTAALVEPIAPRIAKAPADRSVPIGNRAGLTIDAQGPNLTYQWRNAGVNIPDGTNRVYNLPFSPAGEYTVVVANTFGIVTSAPPTVITARPNAPGAVVAWGAGLNRPLDWPEYGQSLVPPEALSDVVAVAAGDTHSAALKADGAVIFWGDAEQLYFKGQFPEAARQGVTAIASGYYHLLALKNDGSVIAWGDNGSGQTSVPVAARSQISAIAAGDDFSLALTTSGAVLAWGGNYNGQTNVPIAARSGVVAISAHGSVAMALKSDGSAIAWGSVTNLSAAAQTGLSAIFADDEPLGLKPDRSVVYLGSSGNLDPDAVRTGVADIGSGDYFHVALKTDGTVVTWGWDNDYGQTDVPPVIQGQVSAVAVGRNHTLAIVGTTALQTRLAGGAIQLSWPTNLVGFHLETAPEFAAANWKPVPDAPTILGKQNVNTRPIPGAREFYRLNR